MKIEMVRGWLPVEVYSTDHWMAKLNCTLSQAEDLVKGFRNEQVFVSRDDVYQCNVRLVEATDNWPEMYHLSIKRKDKEAIHDWRVMQAIKNDIVGKEFEGVELYPAESRLVDTANQYHMWVLTDDQARFPFGWEDRLVSGEDVANLVGAAQRPFDT